MKKTLIEVKSDKLSENSIIVFKNNEWVAIPKNAFLDGVSKEIALLKEALTEETRKRLESDCLIDIRISAIDKRIKVLEGEEENEEE